MTFTRYSEYTSSSFSFHFCKLHKLQQLFLIFSKCIRFMSTTLNPVLITFISMRLTINNILLYKTITVFMRTLNTTHNQIRNFLHITLFVAFTSDHKKIKALSSNLLKVVSYMVLSHVYILR